MTGAHISYAAQRREFCICLSFMCARYRTERPASPNQPIMALGEQITSLREPPGHRNIEVLPVLRCIAIKVARVQNDSDVTLKALE